MGMNGRGILDIIKTAIVGIFVVTPILIVVFIVGLFLKDE